MAGECTDPDYFCKNILPCYFRKHVIKATSHKPNPTNRNSVADYHMLVLRYWKAKIKDVTKADIGKGYFL